ncbi:MAG: VOC family protein [Burkholderiales bacterium]|nr:VOC family protein [Burkholderiales bacterium]
MAIRGMNHFTILTDDVEATREFYCSLLDLTVGWRPNFNFPGLWLYAGGAPILHVIGGRPRGELQAGVIDHMAFSATDLAGTVRLLRERGIAYDLRRLANSADGQWQLFFHDPNGAKVEFDFDAAEPAPA